MTSVTDIKTEKINDRSTFDRENFMFKFIKTRNFLKAEQNTCYLTSKKNQEYIYRKLKKHDETSNACKFLKEFKDMNEVHEFYKEATEMNQIQSLKSNEHR